MNGDNEPPDGSEAGDESTTKRNVYVVLVGVVFFLIVAVALINMLRTEDSGTLGIGSVLIGEKVPEFAVPVATSDLDGDANVDPDQACSVDLEGAMRICDYFDRPLVMSFWFTKGSSQCIDQQASFEEAAAKYGDRVGFVSINVRDDRDRVRELIEENEWKVPVGYDRDGAVSNIYKVGVCPTFLFIKPGGVLKSVELGNTTLEEFDSQVRSLLKTNGKEIQAGNPVN